MRRRNPTWWWILGILALIVNALAAVYQEDLSWRIVGVAVAVLCFGLLFEEALYIMLQNRRIRQGDDYDEESI